MKRLRFVMQENQEKEMGKLKAIWPSISLIQLLY